jgi:multidrug efflux system membrane fusion protein
MTRRILLLCAAAAACSPSAENLPRSAAPIAAPTQQRNVAVVAVRDSIIASVQNADGISAPIAQALVSTRLMASITDVLVHEGDRVSAGQTLVRIDARDLDAKTAQVTSAIAAAEAGRTNALQQLTRIRALYADSAAPRAMLDAAEAGFAQADAGVRAARASSAEVAASRDYATVRAPFAGRVTKRFVDPGAFAAPGAPLVQIQDDTKLRITATASPDAARRIKRGDRLDASVDGVPVVAIVEGVVPSPAGGVYVINAIADNVKGLLASGSGAVLRLPAGQRHALLVPAAAVLHRGDLTGVRIRVGKADDIRWVKIGTAVGSDIEILSGLRAGEQVLVATGATP